MAAKPRKAVPKRIKTTRAPAPDIETAAAAATRARDAKKTFGKASNKTFMPTHASPRANRRSRKDDTSISARIDGFLAMLGALVGRGGKQSKTRHK